MFTDSFTATLTVTIGSNTYEVYAGSIRAIRLHMGIAGFEGSVRFTQVDREDSSALFTDFIKNDITTFTLSVQGTWNQPDETPDPLYVEGIVTRKAVRERAEETMKDVPVLWYEYEMDFKDAVQVLWRRHFPVEIYAESTMASVITDNCVTNFTVTTDWDDLLTQYDQICLALGCKDNRASFYDFILWYAKTRGGNVYYDYTNKKLVISGSKPSASDTSTLSFNDLSGWRLVVPETLRNNIRLHNVSSESNETSKLTQDEAVTGIYRDHVIRTDITSDVTTEKSCLKKDLYIPANELHLEFGQLPRTGFTVGSQIQFDDDKRYQSLSFYSGTFRVYEIDLEATAVNQVQESGADEEYASFNATMTARMEDKDNDARIFPEFIEPRYPLSAEGTVVSETGEDDDKTYQIYTDDDTSLEYYKVYIPLWDLNILTRWIPDFLPGHLYFPAFRDTRVLVELDLHTARISRFLDWGDSTRLPSDYQGNHILFGKNDEDQTSMQHYYDESKPVLSIERTYGTDTQLIKVSDESILLQTQESEDGGES